MSRTFRKITGWEFDEKGKRDRKKWHKPDSFFKKLSKRKRKAKEKVFFQRFGEVLNLKRTDQWDWL